uniref:U15-Theriditoxin-Lha1a_1 n=1 Tax=Latrodectus hasselti TaxID=256736 RepID=A0A482ZAF3_LATHA
MKSIFCLPLALMCFIDSNFMVQNYFYESELLEEGREECAKENESCSKMGMGSGPTECCAPKECTCVISTRLCDCKFDKRNVSVGKDWDQLKINLTENNYNK